MNAARRNPVVYVEAAGRRMRTAAIVAGLVISSGVFSVAAGAGEKANPAHDIADKFSRAGGTKQAPVTAKSEVDKRTEEQLRAYEEDMLTRARAEQDARTKADLSREEQAARYRTQREADQRARQEASERERLALDKEIDERKARAEAEARHAAELEAAKQREAERQSAERDREARKLADRLSAARKARADERARIAAETAAGAEAQTIAQAEARARTERARARLNERRQRLAARIEAAERSRLASQPVPVEPYGLGAAPIATGTTHRNGAHDETSRTAKPRRVTVLLVMTPGKRGIRRWNKTADPMLCIEGGCYISTGGATPARFVSRSEGFGPGIALGERAGACRNQLACAFRDVDLTADRAWMQPIDLRILRHDRRESRMVSADPSCRIERGHLTCARTVEGQGYRAWIVPENVASEAGEKMLAGALERELGEGIGAVSANR